jgi:hypothetical protein
MVRNSAVGRASRDQQRVSMGSSGVPHRILAKAVSERLRQRGYDVEQVADNAKPRQFEDGGIWVLVDGYNHFAGAHPSLMLDRSRDSACDVQIRSDDFPSLAHLVLVRDVAGVHSGPASAYGLVHRLT